MPPTELLEIAKELHVVFLVNFVAPNHLAVFNEVQRHVGRLSILASVAMEANRDFKSEHEDLNVIIQKTHTLTRTARHPSGYEDVNYIHIPLDTVGQLRRLRPDVVVSLELGARTISAMVYQKLNRRCAVVAAICASEHSEQGRGFLRRFTRRRILRNVDWVTYNGPSCKRYLLGLGARSERTSEWDYAADPSKIYRGPISRSFAPNRLRLLTVGQLSQRKGMMEAISQLAGWAATNPTRKVDWNLLGKGPLESEMRHFDVPENLGVHFHGHCGVEEIQEHYRDNDFLLFPTLGDEWGLVVDEALHSGLPVIGSLYSQAIETMIQDSVNGWRYNPENPDALADVLTNAVAQTEPTRDDMIARTRDSASLRTPENSAIQFLHAVEQAARTRRK